MPTDGDVSGIQRTRYSAYGVAEPLLRGDIDADGDVDSDDLAFLVPLVGQDLDDITGGGDPTAIEYRADADLNLDGVIDNADLVIVTDALGSTAPVLWNTPCSVGYAAGMHEPVLDLWLFRNRWYDSVNGKWLTRDPAGYVDGLNLHQYVSGNPYSYWDPFGLACTQFGNWVENLYTDSWLENTIVGNELLVAGLTVDELGNSAIDARENAVDTVSDAIVESDFSATGTVGTLREGAVDGLANAAVTRDSALNGGVPTEGGSMRAVVGSVTGFNDVVDGAVGVQTGVDIYGNEMSGLDAASKMMSGGGTLGLSTFGPAALTQRTLTAGTRTGAATRGAGPAHNASNGVKLNKNLASQQQIGEAGRRIAGPGTNKPFRNANRIAQQNGGNASDWAKMTSTSHRAPDGIQFQTRWAQNIQNGTQVEFKTIITGGNW